MPSSKPLHAHNSTAATSGASQPPPQMKQPMSRISSMRRDWNDEPQPSQNTQSKVDLSQDTDTYAWSCSPSPEPKPKVKAPLKATTTTIEQFEARFAVTRKTFNNRTKELENLQRAGQLVSKATSSAFAQPKPTVSNGFVYPMDNKASHPPPRPAKRILDVIDLDTSDDESRGGFPPPRKARKTGKDQSAGGIAKPWDRDHSKMKKPPRISVPGPGEKPETMSKNKTPRVSIKARIELSAEQRGILQLVLQGQNVFFTGSAGTGKSVLLRRIISDMKSKNSKHGDKVAVTAPTGIAACNIGGVTVHSFGGIGLGNGTVAQLVAKINKQHKAASRWRNTDVLIIDEVSMMDGDLFDKLENVARQMRKSEKPFGGMQLVIAGDFFQLPPVSKSRPKFAFEAESWTKCIDRTINLTKVFRQKDQTFINMLNEMRFGRLSRESIQRFQRRSAPLDMSDNIEPTELFPRREDVDMANLSRLKALKTESATYKSVDGGNANEASRNNMLSNFLALPLLTLKVDAQVMMIKNIDDTLVNGAIGKVTAFMSEDEWDTRRDDPSAAGEESETKSKKTGPGARWPVVKFKIPGTEDKFREELVKSETFKVEGANGTVEASRAQIPLVLAWALSIHKSQGQTIPKVKVDLRKVFEKGQAYVAISRATCLEGLQILNFQPDRVMAHPAVIEWSKELESL